jgi:hypothetical protein
MAQNETWAAESEFENITTKLPHWSRARVRHQATEEEDENVNSVQ